MAFPHTANAQIINYNLDFDPTKACGTVLCSDGGSISQSYGDAPGVDVQWSTGTGHPVSYWQSGFVGLSHVAYAAGGLGSGPLIVDFLAVGGSKITLNSFHIGDYLNLHFKTKWSVSEIGGGVLASADNITLSGQPLLVSGTWASHSGIRLTLGPDAWYVGLDNLNFDVDYTQAPQIITVNEPAPFVLMGLGLMGICVARRTAKA